MANVDSSEEVWLVVLAQGDDRDAVQALFMRVQGDLLRYISGIVGRDSAEDVLQNVFVNIWRNLRWLHEPRLFRPWAYRIASRACFQFLKRERRWTEHRDIDAAVEDLPSSGDRQQFQLIAGLERLVEDLSPASRAVLFLHYGQDLPIEDVAAILEISTGTAKSRLAYGLASLRKSTRKES